ncbi:MAG: hypothetical protein AAFN81_11200 [Bacteroidota bacterium]
MFRYLFSLLLLLIISSCGSSPAPADAVEEPVETLEKTAEPPQVKTDTTAESEPVAMPKSVPAAPELGVDFPEDQLVNLGPTVLTALCQHKYGCIEEELYPLGWSPDGKFAFMLMKANEAVQNTTIHFIVQDMDSDEILEKQTFKASEEPGWTEAADNYSALGVWRKQETVYQDLIEKYQIRLGAGTDFMVLPMLEEQHGISFATQDKMRQNALFGIQEVDQHRLLANTAERQSKTICRQTMGKYDQVIASQPLGGFVSPFEDRLAVLDGLEKRGYEGPPNVLRLQLVGCDLKKGFE